MLGCRGLLRLALAGMLALESTFAWAGPPSPQRRDQWVNAYVAGYRTNGRATTLGPTQCTALLRRARELTTLPVQYDPAYQAMRYPNGDVPATTGVCADLVVRSLRAAGFDLQELVHDDLHNAAVAYPTIWGQRLPDANIDHRRVPNLMTYFTRHHAVLRLSTQATEYAPCDLVAWDLGSGVTHIGVVSERKHAASGRPLVLHHISGTPTEVDALFAWRIIGHYAW